ncbi:MAG: (d)CMP kinase [Candidatus Omnitrophica bacterium]|nr:(d)CMP kinase [Candidatus Omnitrophota bacterium]
MPKPNVTVSIKLKIMVIAIDGPAGAGKSTVAKLLAQKLGISYLDTGAMYRALTVKAIRSKVDLENGKALAKLATESQIQLRPTATGLNIFLDGEDVSEEIRTVEVTNKTFYIARAPEVREIMVNLQRAIGHKQSIVAEGRDIGTVVFPNATKKFYLDADPAERARRRMKEMQEKGKIVDEQELLREINERDQKDFTRKVGPLKKADDAIVIDSSGLNVEQSVAKIMEFLK